MISNLNSIQQSCFKIHSNESLPACLQGKPRWVNTQGHIPCMVLASLFPIQTLFHPQHAGLVALSCKTPHFQPNVSTCSKLSKQDAGPVKIRPWASEHKDPKWQNRFIPENRVAHHFCFLDLWAALVSAPIEAFSQFSGLPKFFCLNEIMPFVTTLLDLEIVTPSEVSQTEKEKYHMTSLICGI